MEGLAQKASETGKWLPLRNTECLYGVTLVLAISVCPLDVCLRILEHSAAQEGRSFIFWQFLWSHAYCMAIWKWNKYTCFGLHTNDYFHFVCFLLFCILPIKVLHYFVRITWRLSLLARVYSLYQIQHEKQNSENLHPAFIHHIS